MDSSRSAGTVEDVDAFWSADPQDLLRRLTTTAAGLSTPQAEQIRRTSGVNQLQTTRKSSCIGLLLSQFKGPVSIILLAAAVLSAFLGDTTDAIIIFIIILVSGLLGFWQEKGASDAMQDLLSIVTVKALVFRDGQPVSLPTEQLVPGDIIQLRAGDLIPADCYLLDANELYVNEATLTGETYPVDKLPGITPADTPIARRQNALFMGSHVVSGSGKAVVVHTGIQTELGHIANRISAAPPETGFERGVRHFGYMLMQITLVLVMLIFAVNVGLHKPALNAFMFSLAIAVGLTPQLLPAIISINLSKGAGRMARQQVIIKRLSAIENIGSMNILCSDKTGTLTEGNVKVDRIMAINGQVFPKAQLLAKINAQLQQGFRNPIDEAILSADATDVAGYPRLDEIPYDFIRKRLTILTELDGQYVMSTKGAVQQILSICVNADNGSGRLVPIADVQAQIDALYHQLSSQGFRTLGIATKIISGKPEIDKPDEAGMTFLGLITLFDPPKAGIQQTLNELSGLGIQLKMITGDNALVAASAAARMGIHTPEVLTGSMIRQLSPEALRHKVRHTSVFAEVEPNQKESLIRALQQAGFVVGYIGDGINDASALHAADVGISVDTAVDVAKESADIVLLQQNLNVLIDGVREGRRTFANTMKYIFMATSANFGNMFSMAGASLFLPFLPLLPTQILLTNLLTDLPQMVISSDNVEPDTIDKPTNWDLRFIRRFMLTFGLLSSVFDYISFFLLLYVFRTDEAHFQTGWFVESVLSASVIVLVVRTRRVFYRARPGKWLVLATVFIVGLVLVLPVTPVAQAFGFKPLPLHLYGVIPGIVGAYAISAEGLKYWFYKHERKALPG
ncbi:magnesium-translocating P-type ATPase [Arsenicibacter rosenii]|uniref:Magnesium-transporting ATPase, P-type 1 n=1 Tax=Arsenicibacter rosenii TaxID=1750698 RepID=A0A1S2VQK2_9BACT|nr:magnesium-translocating P-type ATPase [Arsenicibacter rosenii]OIN61067.1 magnesium-translocating P-type ATPase [Arsenicibacter rosenii]